MGKGWKNESRRHALAAKGVRTTTNKQSSMSRASQYSGEQILPLSEQRKRYEKTILDSIDNDGYDNAKKLVTPKDKLQFAQDNFKSEYGFAISRKGEQKARAEWLSGLPGSVSLPFYNRDIIALAKKNGSLRKNATEKEEDKVIDGYWNYMSNQISRLNTKYGVK